MRCKLASAVSICGLLFLMAGRVVSGQVLCDDTSGGKVMVLSPVKAADAEVQEFSHYDKVAGQSFCYVTRPKMTPRGPGVIDRDGAYWFFYGDVPGRGKIVGIYSPAWPNVWTELDETGWLSRHLGDTDYCTRTVAVTLYRARFMKVELRGVDADLQDKVSIQGVKAEYVADTDDVIHCRALPGGFVTAKTPLVFKIPGNDNLVASGTLVVRFELQNGMKLDYEVSLRDLIKNESFPLLSMAHPPVTDADLSPVARQLRQTQAAKLQKIEVHRTIQDSYVQ